MKMMKTMMARYRRSIWIQSLLPCCTISALLYVIIRCMSFDFPMSWSEELLFFTRVFLSGGALLIGAAIFVIGCYRTVLRLRRLRKRPG